MFIAIIFSVAIKLYFGILLFFILIKTMPDLNTTKSSLKLVEKRSSDQDLMEQPAITLQVTDEIERSTKAKVRFSGNDEYYS